MYSVGDKKISSYDFESRFCNFFFKLKVFQRFGIKWFSITSYASFLSLKPISVNSYALIDK